MSTFEFSVPQDVTPIRVVWLVTYATMPNTGGSGGCDWYFTQEAAMAEFESYLPSFHDTQVGLLSVPVPERWTQDKIDEYIADVYNLLPYPGCLADPLFPTPLAPAAAGESNG
jgi:hypothetical protein